ncbi:MAG TPA: glutamyl-tRNA amidotransferase, partial [Flavobacteriales bacterium]|nr:glutamyl-tRNA amidotransferase [Flavobacteriales bacterium]
MSLAEKINNDIKEAMKAKDKEKLFALRAVKSALLLAATEKGNQEISEDAEVKILQKLVKQRLDSAQIYKEQGREDMAQEELFQAEVIKKYLPEQLSEDEIRKIVGEIIAETGASSMKDMG